MKSSLFFFWMIPVVLILPGCGSGDKPADANEKEVAPESPTTAAVAIPVEKHEELKAFIEEFCFAAAMANGKAMAAPWNTKKLAETMFNLPSLTTKRKNEAIAIFVRAIQDKEGGLMNANLGADLELLNLRNIDGQTRAICRVYSDTGMNYLDIIVEENSEGEFEFIDAYTYATGELLSVTMRELMLPALAAAWKTPVQKFFSGDDLKSNAMVKIGPKLNAGDFEGAIREYESFPEEVANERRMLSIKIVLASRLMMDPEKMEEGNRIYDETIKTFESLYSDDPSFLLMGIDYYFIQEEWDKLALALDQLDEKVGGDPFLNLFRFNALTEQGKVEESKVMLDQFAKDFPDSDETYWAQVQYGLIKSDFEYVAERLTFIAKEFELEIDLEADESYRPFAESQVGKAWQRGHLIWLNTLNSGTPQHHQQRQR